MKDNKTLQIIAFFILTSAFIRIFTHLSESWLLSVAIIALCIALYDICELAIEDNAESQTTNTALPVTQYTQGQSDLVASITVRTKNQTDENVPHKKLTFKQRIKNTGLFFGLIVGSLAAVPIGIIKIVKVLCTSVIPIFVALCLFLYFAMDIDLYVTLAKNVGHFHGEQIEVVFQNLIEIFDLLSLSLVIFGLAYRDRKKKNKPIYAVFG